MIRIYRLSFKISVTFSDLIIKNIIYCKLNLCLDVQYTRTVHIYRLYVSHVWIVGMRLCLVCYSGEINKPKWGMTVADMLSGSAVESPHHISRKDTWFVLFILRWFTHLDTIIIRVHGWCLFWWLPSHGRPLFRRSTAIFVRLNLYVCNYYILPSFYSNHQILIVFLNQIQYVQQFTCKSFLNHFAHN